MDHIPRLSEVLYVGLCRKIGTPTEMIMRRDVMDMEEKTRKPLEIYSGMRRMLSGSNREGFRMETSDCDVMHWFCLHKTINEISQVSNYDASKHTIILMEDTYTPPGFVRLQILTQPRDTRIASSIVPFKNRKYISNSLWRHECLKVIKEAKCLNNVNHHGPCSNAFRGCVEIDVAFCFASTNWPKSLLHHWIERCLRHAWPTTSVFAEILNSEYHCVAIESKIISKENVLEWRLSFSQAEQKMVYAMNHAQILCYGLLKLFLKEVISSRMEEQLLCSYFMKTTMFWMIQVGSIKWRPDALLVCFWKCFKYVIHCVLRGDFPNFFIPQNNMFLNKVIGAARESLLERLNQYYTMGVSCLLHSPTIRSVLEPALASPSFVILPSEGHVPAAIDVDILVQIEISLFFPTHFLQNLTLCFVCLKTIEELLLLPVSQYQSLLLQSRTAENLFHIAFIIANSTLHRIHKNVYALDRRVCNILKLAASLSPVSHLLYLALYYYSTRRYSKALHITNITKQRISQPFILYNTHTAARLRYSAATGDLSMSRKMKTAWANDIRLFGTVFYIEELTLEQEVANINHEVKLIVSPFVIVEMLSVLCYYRLGNTSLCQQSLTDLQTVLIYDDGRYVPFPLRDLAWQILGICQHVVGDIKGALQSYEESLRQKPYHKIRKATKKRMECAKHQLHRNALVQ